MKKIFTLISMALMSIGANAQNWVAPETAPAAGTSIIKGDLLKVETVFETTCGKLLDESEQPAPQTFGGKTFETYMQLRVDAAPTASVPAGTEKSGNTPLVITAKKNVDLTIYYRRQAVDGAYVENDGKDLKLVDQSAPATAITAASYNDYDIDGSYGNIVKTFKLDEGKVYTLWARGTTIRLYGIDYVEGTGSSTGGGESGTANEFSVSFNGANVESTSGYFTFNSEKHNFNKKFTDATYDGVEYTSGLKMEGATLIKWTSAEVSTVTIVQSTWSDKTIRFDWTGNATEDPEGAAAAELNVESATAGTGCRIYTIEAVAAGDHQITRGSGESGIFFVKVTYTPGVTPTSIKNAIKNIDTTNVPVYNLAGQKVDQNYKGVKIQNGKKFVK